MLQKGVVEFNVETDLAFNARPQAVTLVRVQLLLAKRVDAFPKAECRQVEHGGVLEARLSSHFNLAVCLGFKESNRIMDSNPCLKIYAPAMVTVLFLLVFLRLKKNYEEVTGRKTKPKTVREILSQSDVAEI